MGRHKSLIKISTLPSPHYKLFETKTIFLNKKRYPTITIVYYQRICNKGCIELSDGTLVHD